MRAPAGLRPFAALVTLGLLASACGSTNPDRLRINDFAWLAGSWTGPGPEELTIEEQWSNPQNGIMTGLHIARFGEDIRVRGEMRLVGGENGVVMIGSPEGQPASNYPLVEYGNRVATFANRRASQPQLCRFERTGDRLTVTFESIDSLGATRRLKYELHRSGPPPQ